MRKACVPPSPSSEGAAEAACNANTSDRNSFGTRVTADDGLHLVRVRDVEADGSEEIDAQGQALIRARDWEFIPLRMHDRARNLWVVFDGTEGLRPGSQEFEPTADISDIFLAPGKTVLLANTRDLDGDGVWELEELAAGSSDLDVDSDDDDLSDWHEIRGYARYHAGTPDKCPELDAIADLGGDWPDECLYRVFTDRRPGGYRVYSDPTLRDTDGDGLSDGWEAHHRLDDGDGDGDFRDGVYAPLDPRSRDTDEDGISDETEYVAASNALDSDTDGDGLTDGFEVRIGLDPVVRDAGEYLDLDGDGLPESLEGGGWSICIGPFRERQGRGWGNCTGGVSRTVRSNDSDSDSDDDGLSDFVEWSLGTDPSNADTDGDGLSDRDEWDHRAFFNTIRQDCGQFLGCEVPDPEVSRRLGTIPWHADSDGDGLGDGAELRGWTVTLLGPGGDDVPPSTQTHSDPLRADSDGDGLSDGDEFNYLGGRLNPQSADTDSDGLADALEGRVSDDFGRHRHPLRPDRRFVISFTGEEGTIGVDRWRYMGLAAEIHTRRETFDFFSSTLHAQWAYSLPHTEEFAPCHQPPVRATGWPIGDGFRSRTTPRQRWSSLVIALGYDETASIFGRVTQIGGATANSLNCNQRNHYFFGGEGRTPEEMTFDGSRSEPLLLAFTQDQLWPECQGGSCGFNASWTFRVDPIEGNHAVRGDIRLSDPHTGLPVQSARGAARVEYYNGDRWQLVCRDNVTIDDFAERVCSAAFAEPAAGAYFLETGRDDTLVDIPVGHGFSSCEEGAVGLARCVSGGACGAGPEKVALVDCNPGPLPGATRASRSVNLERTPRFGQRFVIAFEMTPDARALGPLYYDFARLNGLGGVTPEAIFICTPGQLCTPESSQFTLNNWPNGPVGWNPPLGWNHVAVQYGNVSFNEPLHLLLGADVIGEGQDVRRDWSPVTPGVSYRRVATVGDQDVFKVSTDGGNYRVRVDRGPVSTDVALSVYVSRSSYGINPIASQPLEAGQPSVELTFAAGGADTHWVTVAGAQDFVVYDFVVERE
jgi:hypothetical protein